MAKRRYALINRAVTASGAVTSFNARTGAVVPAAGDYDAFYYTETEIDNTFANYTLTSGLNIANWDTAYGWGDHASGGYLTSETSHADVVVDGDFASNGILKRTAAGVYGIVTDNSANWDTAYGWGDHSGLYSLAAHVHEGTEIDATAVTDGWVLTADGAGNAAWEAAAGGGLSNIVEDVSPQLGADLQSNTFDIDMADNDFVTFGTSRDVAMGWDGTDLEVTGTADWTMNLRDGCNLTVYGSSDTNYIRIDNNNTDGYIYTNSGDIALLRSGVSALTTQAHTDTGHTSSAQVGKHDLTFEDVGFNALPIFNDDVSDTLEASHSGHINIKELTTARTLTLCASTDLDFPVEHVTHVANVATNDYTITEGATTTLYLVDPGTGLTDTTGGCTIGPGGFATIWRRSATVYWIWGSEITA